MDKETKEILASCAISTRVLAKTFFPERFNREFAEEVHGKIFDLIDDPDENQIAIAAPRGWGKTSIVALALMARHILFDITKFICYINKSHEAASLQTENLKRELVTNRVIRAFFGSPKPGKGEGSDFEEVFSKKSWVAYDTLVWPRGAGQQVRGVLFKNDRPGLFVMDDLEDKKKVLNDDLRAELKNWLFSDVMEAVPQLHMNWKAIYIDTLKHEDSLLQHLLESKDWTSLRLEACDDNLKSVAPHFVSDEVIKRKWEKAVNAGETDSFYQEHRNLPISTKDSSFSIDYFKYYNVPPERSFREGVDLKLYDSDIQLDQHIETVVILDPAKTVKIHSAETSIVGIGIDLNSARLYVRDIISEKMYPDEIYESLFTMGVSLGAKVLGIEVTSLNEFIKQPIKNYMFHNMSKMGFFELVWLNARGGMKKELRIKELVPYYRGGFIYHNASCANTRKLEQQLMMFPRSKLWDIMDALAYIIEMLELGERYFTPSNEPEDSEAEYAELDYDKPMEEWRLMQ